VTEQLGMPESALRVIRPTSARLRLQGQALSRGSAGGLGGAAALAPGALGGDAGESFLSDNQARDHVTHAELALDADGRFLALKVETSAALGAYLSTFGANIPSAIYTALFAGGYRTPAIFVEVTGVFTNTTQTDAYRGAGRPEACYVLERLADRAAGKLGLDRAEIRRRNFIPPAAMPYKTPIGSDLRLRRLPEDLRARAGACRLRRLSQTPRRRGPPRQAARHRMACYVESSGVAPSRFAGMLGARVGFYEAASLRVGPDGAIRAALGTHNHGQGHATTFAQIIASRLGVDVASIDIVEGDTGEVPQGTGTFARARSRSAARRSTAPPRRSSPRAG